MLKIIENYRHKKTLAIDPQTSDLYIVEFPKSGITWLSTLIANAALIQSGMKERATFFNVPQYVPDIYLARRYVGRGMYKSPRFRFIKSHSEYNPYYNHVVYLARHPLNVMTSYYSFLSGHGVVLPDFEKFINDNKFGLPAWRRHVNSWLNCSDQANRLHLIRYEDIVLDGYNEISALSDNLGLGFDENSIKEAIEFSNIKNMKKSEALYASRNPRYKLSFVKGNKIIPSAGVVEFINESCVNELNVLGYKSYEDK